MEALFLNLCNFLLELDAQAYVIDNSCQSQTNHIDSFEALLRLLLNVILPVRLPWFLPESTKTTTSLISILPHPHPTCLGHNSCVTQLLCAAQQVYKLESSK